MACLLWILVPVGLVLVTTSIVRWFEQVTEGVDQKRWSRVFVLLAVPPATWLYPSRVRAGRPVPAPLHEPVLGFGLPKTRTGPADLPTPQPPPGTPPDFVGPPTPPANAPRIGVDPEQVARLRRKMREQGMLDQEP